MSVAVTAQPLLAPRSARRGRRQRAMGARAAGLRRVAGQCRARRWLRRSVLRTDCPALLTSGSRGETRYASCACSARTIAASQRYEARFARRPRGCAARRRRHRPACQAPAARAPAALGPPPCPAHRRLPLGTRREWWREHDAGTDGSTAVTEAAAAHTVAGEAISRHVATVSAKARAARCRRARAQPRSTAVPARARSGGKHRHAGGGRPAPLPARMPAPLPARTLARYASP